MCTRPDTRASVPIVPSQKENRLLTFKRSSHQCLISLGGMYASNRQYTDNTREFHREGGAGGGMRGHFNPRPLGLEAEGFL